MTDLSALTSLSPAELEAVKAMGVNQGQTDPKKLAGRPQVWQVDNKFYVAYTIPGTPTPLVWEATREELIRQWGGIDATEPPPIDKTMNGAEFQALSPWLAGRINEIRLDMDDPWTQFWADYNKSADLRPWLRDADMLATTATAFLEGRPPSADELSQTEWWQNHTDAERQWLEQSVTMGADEVERKRNDAYRTIDQMLREAGANNIPEAAVRWIANKGITGQWSEAYLTEQVRKLADPYAPGELNWGITQILEGDDNDVPNSTRKGEEEVRSLFTQWLGPTMGNANQDEISRWAGRIRNDPDAMFELGQYLRLQRRALFPGYENENLSYEDIVSPFRRLAETTWGRPVTDETMLVDLVNTGDYMEAQKKLRKRGLDQGVQKVVYDALDELSTTSLGDRVARSTI